MVVKVKGAKQSAFPKIKIKIKTGSDRELDGEQSGFML